MSELPQYTDNEIRIMLMARCDDENINKSALAKEIGVTPQILSDILLKRRRPNKMICQFLEVRRFETVESEKDGQILLLQAEVVKLQDEIEALNNKDLW